MKFTPSSTLKATLNPKKEVTMVLKKTAAKKAPAKKAPAKKAAGQEGAGQEDARRRRLRPRRRQPRRRRPRRPRRKKAPAKKTAAKKAPAKKTAAKKAPAKKATAKKAPAKKAPAKKAPAKKAAARTALTRDRSSGRDEDVRVDALCDDLTAEHDDLDRIVDVASLARPTPAAGWTVGDQISHLWFFDQRALLALTDPEAFRRDAESILAAVSGGWRGSLGRPGPCAAAR